MILVATTGAVVAVVADFSQPWEELVVSAPRLVLRQQHRQAVQAAEELAPTPVPAAEAAVSVVVVVAAITGMV